MDESRQLYLDKPATDAERHIANLRRLIAYMRELRDENFTMERFTNHCGAPACALGHAAHLFEGESRFFDPTWWINFRKRTFGVSDGMRYLFVSSRAGVIRTPQQWADHAESWLESQGL